MSNRPSSSPKHTWSDQDRLMLCLMDICYKIGPKQMTVIFNHYRRTMLSREGFWNGMPVTSIAGQLNEYKNGGTGSGFYQNISAFSVIQLHHIFETHVQAIEKAAYLCRVQLVPQRVEQGVQRPHLMSRPAPHLIQPPAPSFISRLAPVASQFRLPRKRRGSTARTETTVTTWYAESEDTDVDECFVTPTRPQGSLQGLTQGVVSPLQSSPFLPIMKMDNSPASNYRRRPHLLFRAFEIRHGLVSRRYLGQSGPIRLRPPPFASADFRNVVRPHLCRDHTYKSPFLSFAQSPEVGLKHIHTKIVQNVAPSALAIFRYDDIAIDARRRFGHDSGPYLCPVICKQHSPMHLPRNSNGNEYSGTGEFLVWGSVACEPLAIIDGPQALMIRNIMLQTKQSDGLNFDNGTRLAKYLPRNMKNEYLELFLCQLVKSFRVPGAEECRQNQGYLDFVRGSLLPAREIMVDPDNPSDLVFRAREDSIMASEDSYAAVENDSFLAELIEHADEAFEPIDESDLESDGHSAIEAEYNSVIIIEDDDDTDDGSSGMDEDFDITMMEEEYSPYGRYPESAWRSDTDND